jgi:DNA-binding transcriptional ArsR family regulator
VSELWKTFFALGDPNRLTMVQRLAQQGPQSMVQLVKGLPFTRQAGARHVSVLVDAGLASVAKQGREQIVSLEKQNLHLTRMFIKQMEEGWDDRLARLEEFVNDSLT